MGIDTSRVPGKYAAPVEVTIIGCGAVGSVIADILARSGTELLRLYDFDKVDEYNIVNQNFSSSDIGSLKVDALERRINEIGATNIIKNAVKVDSDTWLPATLTILAVDSISARQEIVPLIKDYPFIDVRCGLDFGQVSYVDESYYDTFYESLMKLNDEDISEELSPCGKSYHNAEIINICSNYASLLLKGKMVGTHYINIDNDILKENTYKL